MREAQQTVKWIADACDGDRQDEARVIPIGEAIEDYEVFYGESENAALSRGDVISKPTINSPL
ncbi:hypothetical protein PV433_26035 [Paenibacillus sp. GYB004]|uniref:hypothetical protein n=1 Tax=Paenibacillus sp. GYB004 TaxID=2994393 RepID=UPI002F969CF4